MKGKLALIASISIVLIALGFLVYTGLTDNMVYYYHVDEFMAKASSLNGETVKVNGKVAEGSIQRNRNDYGFVIRGSRVNEVNVTYHGAVPDTFKDGCDVVVEGKYDSGARVFRATTLLAKCPTKYEPQQQAAAGKAVKKS
jgi:cytochrome c-type biogenesis protein CcmE